MPEFKPVQYGRWTIRTKKTYPDQYYVYKVELDGEQVQEWYAVPKGSNKARTIEIAKERIDNFLKEKVFHQQYHTRHFYGVD